MDDVSAYPLVINGAAAAVALIAANIWTYRDTVSDIRNMRAKGHRDQAISEHLNEIEGAPVLTYLGAKLARCIYNV